MRLDCSAFRSINPAIKAASNLTPGEKIEAALKDKGTMTASQIMEYTNLLSGSTYRALEVLVASGKVIRSESEGNPVLFSLVA